MGAFLFAFAGSSPAWAASDQLPHAGEGSHCEDAEKPTAALACYERILCTEGAAGRYREACLERIALHLLQRRPPKVDDRQPDAPPPAATPEAADGDAFEGFAAVKPAAPVAKPPVDNRRETPARESPQHEPDWARDPEPAAAADETHKHGGLFGFLGGSRSSDDHRIESKIVALADAGGGRFLILLANDQVWQEYDKRRIPLRVGDTVTVRERALGSYRMTGPGGLMAGVREINCNDRDQHRRCLALLEMARR